MCKVSFGKRSGYQNVQVYEAPKGCLVIPSCVSSSAIKPKYIVPRSKDGAAKNQKRHPEAPGWPEKATLTCCHDDFSQSSAPRSAAVKKRSCWFHRGVCTSFSTSSSSHSEQRGPGGGQRSLKPGAVAIRGVGAAVDVAVGLQAVLRRSDHVGGFHRGSGGGFRSDNSLD